MKFFHRRPDKMSSWVRQYERLQNGRLFVLASLAAAFTMSVAWLVAPDKPPPRAVARPSYESVSLEHSPAELQRMYDKGHALVAANYIRRDLVEDHLDQMKRGYKGRIGNEGALANALNDLTLGLADPWSRALSASESLDERLRASGKTIGVHLDFTWDGSRKLWKVSKVSGTAEAAGLKVEDEIVAIDGDDPMQYESSESESVKKLLLGFPPDNLVNSLVSITVRRNNEEFGYDIPRVVTGSEDALKAANGKDESVQVITVKFFRSDTLIVELTRVLTTKRSKELRGIVINLSQMEGGTAEIAAQAAALFIREGIVCRVISNVPDQANSYYVDTWQVTTGSIKLVRSGPYVHDARNSQKPVAAKPDVVLKEIKMTTGIFQGPVAIVTDWGTRGAPELFASAIRAHGGAGTKIFAGTTTWGKGLGQKTYDQAGGPYSLRFSTSYHLTNGDLQLERRALSPDTNTDGADAQAVALLWMTERLETIPAPTLPRD